MSEGLAHGVGLYTSCFKLLSLPVLARRFRDGDVGDCFEVSCSG